MPAMHYVVTDGFDDPVNVAALGWLILMAVLYITGAVIYAVRIPERIWPGKFDIWVIIIFFFFYQMNKLHLRLKLGAARYTKGRQGIILVLH